MSQQIIIPGQGDLVAERYEIVDELGRGSYGVVYRARQLDNQRMVQELGLRLQFPDVATGLSARPAA